MGQNTQKLKEHYVCYGIDNYNLYNKDKFVTLKSLANYYLSEIAQVVSLDDKAQSINLLGWSMGGFISLEIAGILEQNGYTNIRIYLLDTNIKDQNMRKIMNQENYDDQKHIAETFFMKSYGVEYTKKVMENYDIEYKMSLEYIKHKLKHSHIILYKAKLNDDRIKSKISEQFTDYLSTLSHNNIDTIMDNIQKLTVVEVHNAHHGNILAQEELLLASIY